MPNFDLRRNAQELDPLAHFKVLAVMCHPNDWVRRERMIATVQKGVGEGILRRRPLSRADFMAELNFSSARAVVAGGLLLTRVQLFQNRCVPSLNRAMPMVSALLPMWRQELAPIWHKGIYIGHRPTSRTNMLQANRTFRTVAHLWAALIHALQHDRDDIWSDSLATLPAFLAYAENFLSMACALPVRRRDSEIRITRNAAWTFTIPSSLRQRRPMVALPLDDDQVRIYSER